MSELDQYRTGVRKPKSNKFIIVDKNQEIYQKIPVDSKHMSLSSRYMLGILPIVTTATNALYYQKLIAHNQTSEITYHGNNAEESAIAINIIHNCGKYTTVTSVATDTSCFTYGPYENVISLSAYGQVNTSAEHHGYTFVSADCLSIIVEDTLSSYEPTQAISSTTTELISDLMVYPAGSSGLPEGNKDALTLSKFAMGYFPTINFMADGSFDRDRLNNIGVVVFKGYIDAEAGNKVHYEPIEAFAGSLNSKDVDPTTGASRFIDEIINTNSETIEFYSNCFTGSIVNNIPTSKIRMLHINNVPSFTIGFEETDTKDKVVSTDLIMSSLDKIFEKSKDLNKRQIDIVVDAGLANIAQCMYTVNGNG